MSGVRLTRRGRVVVVCALGLVVLTVLWLGARHRARAASEADPGKISAPESVIVQPHDTLWGIAVRTRPGVDPRITVQRIIDLNAMPNAIVNPGQRVLIPSR